ncbi:CaiB/BaiF CoA-transferase family protein [Pseudonocardia xishanensis]|uniref:Alpha-methylacyl-CoA racemase n=1 Tax=Pseudonocardia xishanensis TaxID=630995 RepID=A0ABP8RPJ5_9PSEU
MAGPLTGLRVIEIGALGPVPHAMMLLADLGADVVRVARPAATGDERFGDIQDGTLRGRRQFRTDLKTREGRQAVFDLVATADVLVEGFRPGVAERLGIGPQDCHAVNERLIYGRMTGWGQTGPLAQRAGHDINYLSLTGSLHAIGRADQPPAVPLNLIGDFGGGSMFLVTGILAALHARTTTGCGDVLDVAMVDGVAVLEQPLLSMRESRTWSDDRGVNLIDGGAPFYDTYACADGRFVAVGALEPSFFAHLVAGLGLDSASLPAQYDADGWPALRARLTEAFSVRTRDEWADHFADLDACVTPVLDFAEAAHHPHFTARGTFDPAASTTRAAPAPRFASHGTLPVPAAVVDVELESVLSDWRQSA